LILRLKPLFVLLALAGVVAVLMFGIDRYRHRFVRSAGDMVALLPAGDWTVFFADFSLLRRAGIFKLLSGTQTAEDPEYRAFVQSTKFDYTQDIDSLAGETDGSQIFFLVRGRFSWSRLRQYATNHGGACQSDFCNVPTTRPGRWASFLPIQADVMALAVSADKTAAYQLTPRRHGPDKHVSNEPVWVKVSNRLLDHPESLPVAARIFAISLAPAETVVFSLNASGNEAAPFSLQLNADCATLPKADVVRGQLEMQTKMIRAELVREHQQVNPGDLTGLLASGTFEQNGRRVVGKWPVYRQLLGALQ
jgi:hypothetical protein